MTRRQVNLPIQTRGATFTPASVNRDARTAEIVWSTGAAVKRGGGLFGGQPYNEILSLNPAHVRMGRLNAGAPFLNSHRQDLGSVLGVHEKAWLTPTEGRAIVRFSKRPEVDPYLADIADGIIRNVSVGYRVHKFTDMTKDGDKLRTLMATDWEPMETSVVPIGADPGVGFRKESTETSRCEFVSPDDTIRAQLRAQITDSGAPRIENRSVESGRRDAVTAREDTMTRSQLIERKRVVPGDSSAARAGGFNSFGEFLLAVREAEEYPFKQDYRLGIIQRAAAGGSEAVPSDGGFLVAPEFSRTLVQRTYEVGAILSRCLQFPITKPNANGIKFPQFAETSRANGSRLGGVTTYWANEADALTGSKPKFALGELTLKKIISLIYCTDELLNDAGALETFVSTAFSLEASYKIEDGILNGPGAGQLLGILNSPAVISVPKDTNQAAGTISTTNVTTMFSRCWGPSRKSAVWLVNQEAQEQLYTLALVVGAAGAPLPLYKFSDTDGEYDRLMGRPVIPVEQCAAAGNLGDLILADFGRYAFASKPMQTTVSMHVRFLTDESAFKCTWRVDGSPLDIAPITPVNGTATLSPFVAIQAR